MRVKIRWILPYLQASENIWWIFNRNYEGYIKDVFSVYARDFEILYTEDLTAPQSYEQFAQWWINYRKAHEDNYTRIYETLLKEYDPLENMSIKESVRGVSSGADYTSTANKGDYTATNSTNVYDSGSLKPTESGSVSYTYDPQSSTTHAINRSLELSDGTYTGSNSTATDTWRHGNIGVQSFQMYINEEIELRRQHIIKDLMMDFINEYCYQVGDGL